MNMRYVRGKKTQLHLSITILDLPFPRGAASPLRSCERDLLGDPGDSRTVKGSVLRISNFPAWRRNFSSSFERRLNCSVWDRHFSSSSRTLAWWWWGRRVVKREKRETQRDGQKGGRMDKEKGDKKDGKRDNNKRTNKDAGLNILHTEILEYTQ